MSPGIHTSAQPKVGFVGWNPFQFLHVARIIPRFPGATLIVEDRKSARNMFEPESLSGAARVIHCDRKEMGKLDGQYDVLVCQTPFAGIERIRGTKIAMVQYGYAKEAHNFAPWRSFGDVCLTFGDYASRKIEPFCSSVATGNPRYEEWGDESFHHAARAKYQSRIDPAKKTILYAPTWGPLSSYSQFGEAVLALAKNFNVIFKVHHNTQRSGTKSMETLRKKFGVIHGANDDIIELLSVADLMISDFSGAIFDAIYCKVPVVLLDSHGADSCPESKSDRYSIERARRKDLGEIVSTPGDLPKAVDKALDPVSLLHLPQAGLRDELFTDAASASRNAELVIRDLIEGMFQQTQSQSYMREEMRNHYRCKNQFRALRVVGRFLGKRVCGFGSKDPE